MYKCSRCLRLVSHLLAHSIPCDAHCMRIDKWGCLISQHTRDVSWNISSQITSWHKELRSWRKVYWRLWGCCHYLHCNSCQMVFPVNQMSWCQYHSELPQFPGNSQSQSPIGRYSCCGQKAFKYETLPRSSGCEYREHCVEPPTDKDCSILNLYTSLSFVIGLPPSEFAPRSEAVWWTGLSLAPSRSKGLVPLFHEGENRPVKRLMPIKAMTITSESDSDTDKQNGHLGSTSDGEGESEESGRRHVRRGRGHPAKRGVRMTGGLWSGELSARSNQDNQREYEERAMRQLVGILGRRNGGDSRSLIGTQWPLGGSYVKLENEWRDTQSQWPNVRSRKTKK